jgi:hypothetical protein
VDGYLVGERSARLLAGLLDAGGDEPAFARGPGGRAVEWVRVTGGAAPWWAGVVEVPLEDGTWQTLAACEVMTAGGPLKAGAWRYLSRRTGDKADGTPRFVAAMVPTVARSFVTAVACVNGQLNVTSSNQSVPDA